MSAAITVGRYGPWSAALPVRLVYCRGCGGILARQIDLLRLDPPPRWAQPDLGHPCRTELRADLHYLGLSTGDHARYGVSKRLRAGHEEDARRPRPTRDGYGVYWRGGPSDWPGAPTRAELDALTPGVRFKVCLAEVPMQRRHDGTPRPWAGRSDQKERPGGLEELRDLGCEVYCLGRGCHLLQWVSTLTSESPPAPQETGAATGIDPAPAPPPDSDELLRRARDAAADPTADKWLRASASQLLADQGISPGEGGDPD